MGDLVFLPRREPARQHDDGLLRVIPAFERSGVAVVMPDETEDEALERMASKSLPVSPYLRRPLRTEAEVRGKAHPIFETILDAVRP